MGAAEEQGELISAIPDWAALQSCLFIQSSRPLRKWLCLFPSVSCEPWAKYTHTTASQHPPWNSTPHFAGALSAQAIPRIYSPWKASSPLPRRRSSLKWRQRLSRLGMHTRDWSGRSLVLHGTEMRMFPPPWNDCSWTVSALCPCSDRAYLLQPSPRAENFLWLPALYFRKVPIEGARPLPLWLQTQCPWFLVGHLAPWDR